MSRLRSAPAAKGKTTDRPSVAPGARGVFVQAPKSDIYVALLGVALGAMVLGCLFLLLVFNRYGFSTKATFAPTPNLPAAVALATFDKIGTVRL